MALRFLSLISGWCARHLGRAGFVPAAAAGSTGGTSPTVERAEDPGAIAAAAAIEPPSDDVQADSVAKRDESNSAMMKELLQLDSLPAKSPGATVVPGPDARERTLRDLSQLKQIPALKSLAESFLTALNRPDVEMDEVVDAVSKDSALCVCVLRMANSVLVSSEQRIEDIPTAAQMLGVSRIRKAAQALSTLRSSKNLVEGFDWRHLWVHALSTAAIAEELCQRIRPGGDAQLYLAALMHDVGKIVLSTIAPQDYRDVLIAGWNENGRLEDLERNRLGVDHREAGVLFAQQNGLPNVVVDAIAHHDRPDLADKHRFEVAMVAIANYLSKAHGIGFSGARLEESDGEFEDMAAWRIVEETCGARPDTRALEAAMAPFARALRTELSALRNES